MYLPASFVIAICCKRVELDAGPGSRESSRMVRMGFEGITRIVIYEVRTTALRILYAVPHETAVSKE